MNIAFWSGVRHQSGVTSGVALISVLWTELFVDEIAITSNHICNKGLVRRLYGGCELEDKVPQRVYHYMLGEPEYFRMLYDGKMNKTLWLKESLRFVPMEGEKGELFVAEGLYGVNKRVTEQEYLMIDTACGYTLSSQKVLEEAEIKVILFPPERDYIDDFFCSKSSTWENCFFIVGNYRFEGTCRPAYLSRYYNVPRNRIGVIPYNLGFEQAMWEGNTISYITQNMHCSRRSKEYRFIYHAKETVENLRKYAIGRRRILCGECEEVSGRK